MKPAYVVLFGAMALSGCFVLETAKTPTVMGEDAVEHVVAYNYGWNLFGCLPIVCGNDNFNSWCAFTFFKDEVRNDLVQAKVIRYADERNCDLKDFVLYHDREVFFDFYYAPVPWIIQYREVNCSATLVKKSGKESQ